MGLQLSITEVAGFDRLAGERQLRRGTKLSRVACSGGSSQQPLRLLATTVGRSAMALNSKAAPAPLELLADDGVSDLLAWIGSGWFASERVRAELSCRS